VAAPAARASSSSECSRMMMGRAHRSSEMCPSGLEMEQDHLILWVMNTGWTECEGVVQGGTVTVNEVFTSSSPISTSSSTSSSAGAVDGPATAFPDEDPPAWALAPARLPDDDGPALAEVRDGRPRVEAMGVAEGLGWRELPAELS
jgi:hypothetical protein